MKTNKGVLKMNDIYEFIDITDLGEINGTCCDNCGSLLRNVCHIKSTVLNKGVSYFVGTECVKTLMDANISNEYEMMESIKEHKKIASAKNLVKKSIDNKTLMIFKSSNRLYLTGKPNKKPVKIELSESYIFGKLFKPTSDYMEQLKKLPDNYFHVSNDKKHGKYSFCFNDIYERLKTI